MNIINKTNLKENEMHNISIEFSVKINKKDLDKFLTKIGKLLYNCNYGIGNVTIKDEYYIDYVPLDDINNSYVGENQ